MLSLGDLAQLGGVLVVALALVEALKVALLKALNGRDREVTKTIDGFAREIAWRAEIGSIVKEQHQIQKEMSRLLKVHHKDSVRAREKLEDIHNDIDEIKKELTA